MVYSQLGYIAFSSINYNNKCNITNNNNNLLFDNCFTQIKEECIYLFIHSLILYLFMYKSEQSARLYCQLVTE